MTAVVVALAVILVGTIANLWYLGRISEEQAAEARHLATEWKAIELARVGTCTTLLECIARRAALENLRAHNNFLVDRARSTDQPHRTIP